MILSIVLFLILTELTASVRILYTKRSIRAPAWEPLSPQIDVSSVRSIEQILKIKKAQFGGYIHGNESLWGFTTMSFGKDWRGIFYQNLNEKTGDCNFWAEGNYVLELIEENATINADKSNIEMKENGKKKLFYYKSLIDNPSKTCEESKALTPPEYKERLCWICY